MKSPTLLIPLHSLSKKGDRVGGWEGEEGGERRVKQARLIKVSMELYVERKESEGKVRAEDGGSILQVP